MTDEKQNTPELLTEIEIQGMKLTAEYGEPRHDPAQNRKVVDVLFTLETNSGPFKAQTRSAVENIGTEDYLRTMGQKILVQYKLENGV